MKERVILIDIGNVLCKFDPLPRLQALEAAIGMPAEDIAKKVWGSGFDSACDEGRYGYNTICARLREMLGSTLADAEFAELMTAAFTLDSAAPEVLQELAGRAQLGTLSDNGPLIERGLERLCPEVLASFDFPPMYSHHFGATKKHEALYPRLLTRLGAEADKVTLVDDSQQNVDVACRAGINAILFESWPRLIDALQA